MSYRSIMVPVNGIDDASVALALAFGLGQRFDGQVVAVHTAVDPGTSLPYLGEGMSGGVVEEMLAALDREAGQRAEAAHAAFDAAQQAAAEVAGRFVVFTGREEDVVAERGRLADLVVTCRPAEESAIGESPTLHAAIMETGRPMLVAPPRPPKTLGASVVVAWNGSPQAARALGAALPLMQEAAAITLVSIDEGEPREPGPQDAAEYLAAHGHQSKVHIIEAGQLEVGEALLLEARAHGADLLVMGAYTHSRIRELILGGATQEALWGAEVPLLMAH
ncbi:MAG: universal stress protein [Alphaproteobacteria bacterium]|nr:universal stress protein [Alphaproteobacteria bacterium]